jgi:uncharacterized protein
MSVRAVAATFGVAFGFLLAWTGMSDPDVIRQMLLLEEAYLYLVFFSAVAVAFTGLQLLTRTRRRSLVTKDPIALRAARPERRHVVGSVFFGAGWAISSSCPGPIAVQLGQGMLWSLFTIAGIMTGIILSERRSERAKLSIDVRGWAARPARGR